MPIDWFSVAKWLGPKALEAANRAVATRDAADLQNGRNELASAAAREITRMILSGYTTANVNLVNLIDEYENLVDRGAKVPRDLRTMVNTLIEKAQEAPLREYRWEHGTGGDARRYPSAKKAAAKRPAARKAAAKRPAAKKTAAKRLAAKKATAKSPAGRRTAAKP